MQTIIIGHKNPDMDSICSALAYAHLKTALGVENVLAARAGNTNERIDFVLEKFGLEAPVFFSDVSPKVADVMVREVIVALENSSVYQAVTSIEQEHLRGLPVIDEEGKCLGLLSASKISHYFFPPREELSSTRVVSGSLQDMISSFDGAVESGSANDREMEYLLVVAAMSHESFHRRLGSYQGHNILLIVGDRVNAQMIAINEGVTAIVVTGNFPIEPEIREAAEKKGVVLISSRHDTATTLLLARGGVRVSKMLERNYVSLSPETPLSRAREIVSDSSAFVFPVLDQAGIIIGILSKSDFLKPVNRQLILVDHNEMSQAVNGAGLLPIVEVIDHHRLGSFHTETPILFWNNPVGSTCTLVAQSYHNAALPIPPSIAGLLMAGIISDTLNLTSPTATLMDRQILEELSQIEGLSAQELADQIFSVGSPLRSLSTDKIVHADSKEYVESGHRFSVAQIEELSLSLLAGKQAALIAELENSRLNGRLLFAALLVTNINTQVSVLLVCGAAEFLRTIDFPRLGDNAYKLESVVSRKKQLLPYLLQCLHRMEHVSGVT